MLTDLRQRLHAIRSAEMPVEQAYGVIKRKSARFSTEATGARFYCPICGAWYRSFAPFGLRGRPNARCPGCGSLERHRFLWFYMMGRHRILRPGSRILHVAPEACIQQRLLRDFRVRYLGIDRYDGDADAEQQDLTDLPYTDNAFDVVICNHVLEHIPDDRKAIAEISRVLSPNGHALIATGNLLTKIRKSPHRPSDIKRSVIPTTSAFAAGTMQIEYARWEWRSSKHIAPISRSTAAGSTASTEQSSTIAQLSDPNVGPSLPSRQQTAPQGEGEGNAGPCLSPN